MGLIQTVAPTFEPISLSEAKLHLRAVVNDEDSLIADLIADARGTAETWQNRQLVTATWVLKLDRFPSGAGDINTPRPPLQSVTSITYIDTDGDTQILADSVYDVDTFTEPGRIALAFNQSWPSTRSDIDAVTITYVAGYGNQQQETRVTPLAVEVDDVFRILIKGVAVATFTATAATVASVVTGLQASFTADGITATAVTSYLKLLGRSGVAFEITTSTTDGGGADTQAMSAVDFVNASAVPAATRHGMLMLIGHGHENRESVVVGTSATELPSGAKELLMQNAIQEFV